MLNPLKFSFNKMVSRGSKKPRNKNETANSIKERQITALTYLNTLILRVLKPTFVNCDALPYYQFYDVIKLFTDPGSLKLSAELYTRIYNNLDRLMNTFLLYFQFIELIQGQLGLDKMAENSTLIVI